MTDPQDKHDALRHGRRRQWWRWSAQALVVALAGRLLWMTVRYLTGTGGVMRFHVESAGVLFVAVGLVVALFTSTGKGSPTPLPESIPPWTWPLWCAAALLLYWPSLGLGFLSDDFVLVSRAAKLQLGPFNPESFRPIPLLVWGIILRIGGTASAMHVLNVLLHGTNAFLTTRLVRPMVSSSRLALLAGALILTAPVGPEAVAWNSGIFDVMATALLLATLLTARGYSVAPSLGRRLAFVVIALAAFLCKETAGIAGPIVVLDGLVWRRQSRKLYIDAAILTGITAGIIGLRLVFGSSSARQPITRYLVQRWLFGTLGGLLVPWHADVIRAHPWVPIAGIVAVLAIVTLFFVQSHPAARIQTAMVTVGWCLLATLPPIALFFVAPDLQGARYLYVATVGYAATLMVTASVGDTTPPAIRMLVIAAIAVLVITGICGVRWHLHPWYEAASLRDRVIAAASADRRIQGCASPVFADLPDTVRGAYVFRNGGEEALKPRFVSSAISTKCSFRWNGHTFVDDP
jgi:hypothetical protein